MLYRRKRFSIPEYREKKEIYELLGYKEVSYKEKGIHCYVKFELDETNKYYWKLRKLERQLFPKGPPFIPIVILVVIAFLLLSSFVIILARCIRDGVNFDLASNACAYLLPALIALFLDVVYTFIYLRINQRIIEERPTITIEFIKDRIEQIKNN